ncbi:MAG: UDP-N-acetylmuramoyl-L-alanyl-D-glutamate--2,6-diaminopimelate ligase [Actinomycetota bacterium]
MDQPIGRILAALRGGPAVRLVGDADAVVTDLTLDSRQVDRHWMFCCIRGEHSDGHDFAAAAVEAGASVLLVERELSLAGLPAPAAAGAVAQAVVSDSRAATGWFAAAVHGHPSDDLRMIGVTGTNGKTTTAQLIGDVFRHAGRRVEVFGTLTGRHTTPEAPDLQRRLAACRDSGVEVVVMEVSSHALALERVAGTRFDVAVFTNLGRDHLDLHGTTERYFAAKARLFEPALSDVGVVNVDDVHGRLLFDSGTIPMRSCSIGDVSEIVVGATRHSYRWREQRVSVGMGGGFNVLNSLAAAEACRALGLSEPVIAAGLSAAGPVPGRFEPIDEGQPFAVVVDYAHTPDGIREVLRAARATTVDGRVLVVFGCGGDRDSEKRPEMAAAAVADADEIVITSDNPRSEDPAEIISAIVAGVPDDYRGTVVIEADRRTAIALAFAHAGAGDIVVVAGKGHETTQSIGDQVVPFDDRSVARSILRSDR